MSRVPVAVLISGSGTNLQALIDASRAPDFPAELAVVVSNRERAFGLDRARAAGIPTEVVPGRAFPMREDYDRALVDVLRRFSVQWVALAGFMRLVTPVLLEAFPWRVLNIHPALLPAFPGLHAQEQALAAGVTTSGATVHFVDAGMDTGPIIAQRAVPVLEEDTLETLKARNLSVEHQLYPMVLKWAAEGRIFIDGRKVSIAPTP